jgi:hypothetical protein
MKRVIWRIFFALVLILALTQQRPAHAGIINGTVSLGTVDLAGSGTFELVFVLTDGSGVGDANNSVTLSNFAFGADGSGGSVDARLTTGGVIGDLTSGVTLTDSAFLNVFASTFTPGNLLTFDFALTTNVDSGGTPDQFLMVLLQPDGTPLSTTDPSGSDALLLANIDSAQPAFNVYGTVLDILSAPTVTFAASVPEPPSLLLLAIGLVGLVWMTRGRRGAVARSNPSAY